ncbi:MAG: molecular chaperone DnaJ [Opitutaceae bacterium]|nr:molecular chaperone DnaJ [Opitutaceae bacterium]
MDRIAHFSKLVDAQPGNVLFRFSLAQALLTAGRPGEAEGHLRQCADARSDWMIPRIELGKILLSRGQFNEANSILNAALELAIAQHHESPAEEVRALLATLQQRTD